MSDEDKNREVSELLKKVRKIELRTRGMVRESFGGEYHSCFKGEGIDFEDFREYQHGDEVRAIDWNVTARMGAPYIKNFVEERELSVYICVDISASGNFGSVELSKRELMAEVAALMAFSAMQNKDKVALVLFTDDVELYLPPKKGIGHALRLIREILHYEPSGTKTALKAPCDLLKNAVRKRSLVLMLSDFLFQEDYSKVLKSVARKHDLVALQVVDPAELALPAVGYVRMEDPETGNQVEINTSNPRLRRAYSKLSAEWQENLTTTFARLRIDHLTLQTDQDYLPVMHRFFKGRGHLVS
ncbi:MAG: DUF58 domain-containing protein [Verrucomicrobiales bacterium]|nr:DUF58 domain-containing protein [Verrucomicrobiales bacterium]